MAVPFDEQNISVYPEARRQFKEKEYEFVPVIEAGNTVIVEYTGLPQLIEVLANEGYVTNEAANVPMHGHADTSLGLE